MTDRAMQALYLLGLDPIAETQADGHSYGFRLERRCADALASVTRSSEPIGTVRNGFSKGTSKLALIGSAMNGCWPTSPWTGRCCGKWLKAGFLEKHVLFATTEGTPQGGIVSPALANWTLDGLQRLLAEHFGHDADSDNG